MAELARALEDARTSARRAAPVPQAKRPRPPLASKRRGQPTSPDDRLEQEILSTEQWEERGKIYEWVSKVGESRQALWLLDRLRRQTRNGNDLFFLDQAVQTVGRRSPEQARAAAELRARLYDHMPAPPEELFRWIWTSLDGRVDLWREIPAGTCWIGSPDGEGSSDEHPRYEVTIARPFHCAAVPVTQAQYAAFDDRRSIRDSRLHPVAGVTWFEAVSFCRWLSAVFPWARGARPPVEVEWEYACRAGWEGRYWSGDREKEDLAQVGWYEANSNRHTHQVGEKPANLWGLYDVHGNVCEWTLSPWSGSYEGRENGVTHDPATVEVDPIAAVAPSSGGRVGRGGSYWVGADWARAAYRFGGNPWFVYVDLGFRVVLPPAGLELPGVDLRS